MTEMLSAEMAQEIWLRLYPEGLSKGDLPRRLGVHIQTSGNLLPAAGSALSELGRQLYRDEPSLDRCTEILATDAALSDLILHAAHLASLGSRRFNLPYAVMFLGLTRLRVLFGVALLRWMNGDKLAGGWLPLWERSLFTARLVERLAAHYHPVDGTEYLAGLFHDSAWPTLVPLLRQDCGLFFDEPDALFPLEHEIFGTSHADIGAAICIRSGLAPHVVEAVALHHDAALPDAARLRNLRYSGPFLAVLLRLADAAADACGFPIPLANAPVDATRPTFEEILHAPTFQWLRALGLPPNLPALAEEELSQVRKVGALLAHS